MKKLKERMLRYFIYFKSGHAQYLAFFLSFANFAVIQYKLLIENIPFLQFVFFSLTIFIILFMAIYIPLSTLIGWIHYKKGVVPVTGAIVAQVDPWVQDFMKAFSLMLQDRKEEARKYIEKWIQKWG